MPRAKQTVICFDLDGPILDVSDRYYELYSDLVRELAREENKPGWPVLSKSEYWNMKRSRTREEKILANSGVTDSRLIERYQRRRQLLIESKDYLRLDTVWVGMSEALHSLKGKFALVVATLRSSHDLLLEELEWLGLQSAFDEVVSSHADVEGSSRTEAKARLISARYDLTSMRSWFIGDTETDILAGKALGSGTVGVSFGIRDESTLEAAGPDLLLSTPVELINWLGNLSA